MHRYCNGQLRSRLEFPKAFIGQSFNQAGFKECLQDHGLLHSWPTTKSGLLSTSKETWGAMLPRIPVEFEILAEAMAAKAQASKSDLALDGDVNRPDPMPFVTKTSRNNPPNPTYVLSGPKYTRGLIGSRTEKVVEFDYKSEEFAVAGYLSGDQAMIRAYEDESRDVYTEFGFATGIIPRNAKPDKVKRLRQLVKIVCLSILYGRGPFGLSQALNCTTGFARNVLDLHKAWYPRYWAWSKTCKARARKDGCIYTPLGWRFKVESTTKPTTLQNFPIQATSSEILRRAVLLVDDAGYPLCCTNHDSLLMSCPEELDTSPVPGIMAAAAEQVIGYPLRVDTKVLLPGQTMYPSDPTKQKLLEVVRGVCYS